MNSDRREQILTAVLAVVASQGISAVTIRTVATRAGVSIGLVQHYFPTKVDLIQAAAEFMVSLAEAQYRSQPPRSPREQLLGLLVGGISLAGEAPLPTSVFYSFVAAAVTDVEIARTLSSARSGMVQEVAALVAATKGTGEPVAPTAAPPDGAPGAVPEPLADGAGAVHEPLAEVAGAVSVPLATAVRLVSISDGLTIQVLIGQLDAPSAVAAMTAELDQI